MAEIKNLIETKVRMVKVVEGPNKGKEISIPKSMGHLSISSQDLPSVKTWKVGQDYKLEITVRQTSSSKPDEWDIEQGRAMPEDINTSFDIIGIKIPNIQPEVKIDPASTPAVEGHN